MTHLNSNVCGNMGSNETSGVELMAIWDEVAQRVGVYLLGELSIQALESLRIVGGLEKGRLWIWYQIFHKWRRDQEIIDNRKSWMVHNEWRWIAWMLCWRMRKAWLLSSPLFVPGMCKSLLIPMKKIVICGDSSFR
jgi:hypothetical protein